MTDRAWDTFLLPAPNLQLFEVYFPHIEEPLFLGTFSADSTKRLFGNHAPLLREFHGDGVDFSVDSAWLANLHDIAVPSRLTVPEILELLQHMPLLESFFIPSSDATENWVPIGLFPRVDLPTLTVLLLSNTLPTCSTLLEHIYPATSCSLSLTTNAYYNPSLITKGVLRAIREHLPRFIHNYFATHKIQRLKMRFHDDLFHFEDESPRLAPHIFFNVCVRTKPGSSSLPTESIHDLSELLFPIFVKYASDSPSHFSSVTGLSLDMRHLETSSLKHIYSLLCALPALRRLRTSEDTLVFLLSVEDLRKNDSSATKPPILFTSLGVLQLTYLDPDLFTLSGHNHGSLFPFLKGRVEANKPIDVLDLKLCGPDTLRDMNFIDEMKGLEVQWTEDDGEYSYICGSGMPDRLEFGTRFGWNVHDPLT
ncbi:hypothetical protein JR316_0002812 [Psilocybe cubensis]|nr:hypothetical protein JR316_0002812 [Psilocybe cubensis]KAH9485895.1 hypothetical protein JR316_0002812 [Psilocybe cubensis]